MADNPALIFDFGGVLLDWNPRHLYRKLFPDDEAGMERFLAEIHFDEWNHLQDAGRKFAVAVPELCSRFPQYSGLIRAYDERYPESILGAIPGTVEILSRLKAAGRPLYGLSNWPAEKYDLVRPQYPFLAWFEGVVISGEVGLAKPDLRIFRLLLQRIGRLAGECLLVDDSPTNTAAASRLGFDTILFESPPALEAALAARGLI